MEFWTAIIVAFIIRGGLIAIAEAIEHKEREDGFI